MHEKILDLRERDTRILEKYFGEYPWVKEKIGIAQVPNPGMEHQTMITYGDKVGKFLNHVKLAPGITQQIFFMNLPMNGLPIK